MKDLELEQNVLQEIMDLMDQREGESLKKHPKLAVAKIEVEKPEPEEMEAEELSSEAPKVEGEEEISPEMIQKLLEHFKDLK